MNGLGVTQAKSLNPTLVDETLVGEEETLIVQIPDHVLQRIFWFLKKKDLLAASLVCTKWNELIPSVLMRIRVVEIKVFCEFLGRELENLPKLLREDGEYRFPELNPKSQIEKLLGMRVQIEKPTNISDVEIKTLFILKQLATILVDLPQDVTQVFWDRSKDCPKFLRPVFSLVGLYQKIAPAHENDVEYERNENLSSIAEKLADIGDVRGATGVINLVNRPYWKSRSFFAIARRLKKTGAIKEAIEIAKDKIPDEYWKCHAFIMIALQLAKIRDINRALECFGTALEIADIMDKENEGYFWHKRDAYNKITVSVLEVGGVELAETFADRISDSLLKSIFLFEVVENLDKKGESKMADVFKEKIPCLLIRLESWFTRLERRLFFLT